jgi:hypothetical protein
METIKKKKVFDAVVMMRSIREKVSSETQNMTFAELKEYVKTKITESKMKPVG